jgi:hypothetical protein
MDNGDYARLIGDLCATVGSLSAKEVIGKQHVTIDGKTVGVILDEKVSRELIFVYVDLGAFPEGREQELQWRMLASNPEGRWQRCGTLRPSSGETRRITHVAFRARSPRGGLARLLSDMVKGLQRWSDRLLAAPAPQWQAARRLTRAAPAASPFRAGACR